MGVSRAAAHVFQPDRHAISRRPDLLVIDLLDAETAGGALTAAQNGLVVLSQLDTVFNGASVARHLLDWTFRASC